MMKQCKKLTKSVNLQEGLSLKHFLRLGKAVTNPNRAMGEALLEKVK